MIQPGISFTNSKTEGALRLIPDEHRLTLLPSWITCHLLSHMSLLYLYPVN